MAGAGAMKPRVVGNRFAAGTINPGAGYVVVQRLTPLAGVQDPAALLTYNGKAASGSEFRFRLRRNIRPCVGALFADNG